MRIENGRDLSLTMARNVRQARMEVRAYTKHYTGSSTSLVDTLDSKMTSGENNTANAVNNMLNMTKYNNVKTTSKEVCEKAQQLLQNRGDSEAAVQGVYEFTELYNSLLVQMSRIDTDAMDCYSQELKGYTTKYQEKFQKIGITQGTDGTLQVDPLKIGDADLEAWYDFLGKASKVAVKVQAEAENNLLVLNRNQTIYGTSYNQYGQENI